MNNTSSSDLLVISDFFLISSTWIKMLHKTLSHYEWFLSSNALKGEVVSLERKHVTKQLSDVIHRTWAPYETVFTLQDWASQYQLLRVINGFSLAYCRNVSLSGTAVAGYKTSRFKVSDLKWPELPVHAVWESREQKGTKSNWWGSGLIRMKLDLFWHHMKDFKPGFCAFILEITSSSISVKNTQYYVQLTGRILLSCHICSQEFRYNFDQKHTHLSSCALFVFSHSSLFSLTKTRPLSAKPGGI